MDGDEAILFDGAIFEWRGPAPFLFVAVPDAHIGAIRYAGLSLSYGWGVVPVVAEIGKTRFATSLFPKGGGYLLPVKVAVQKAERIGVGDRVEVALKVGRP
ncbi:DUF1905 domain-containing protein [Sphingopyxis sp.]|uniref:DUF1905 domain-containing protein n=1 Tax=Sphingopyxis sp. TaxID=1908224 RepID=UPI00260E2CD7|nr:DUF1905 domain-containing protein [Sphingopyxis sp.]MCW0198092.1 DUF1905 domain-containing protein [Sphingopyxis sp.]